MRLDKTVTIQSKTIITGNEGERTYSFATYKTINAGVQPAVLSQAELKLWGLTDLSSNSKKMFCQLDDTLSLSMRAVVDGDTYEIRGVNNWPQHTEALLIPVQGIA